MIETFAIVLLAFMLTIAGMAVGALVGRRGLSGVCAGVRATDDAPTCPACGEPAGTGGCTGAVSPTEIGVKEA